MPSRCIRSSRNERSVTIDFSALAVISPSVERVLLLLERSLLLVCLFTGSTQALAQNTSPGTAAVTIKGLHFKTNDVALAEMLGARWVRMWDFPPLFRGDQIEPKPNDWVDVHSYAAGYTNAHIQILGVLLTQQPWRLMPGRVICPNYLHPATKLNRAGIGYNPWQSYCNWVVGHYTGMVGAWEIWDEPFCNYVWGSTNPATQGWLADGLSSTDVVEIARQAAQIIRSYNPRAKIISPTMNPFGCPTCNFAYYTNWTCQCLTGPTNLTQFCDYIAFHGGYGGSTNTAPGTGSAAEATADLKWMRQFTGNLPLIDTETSVDTNLPGELTRLWDWHASNGVSGVFYYWLESRPDAGDQPKNMAGTGRQLIRGLKTFALEYGPLGRACQICPWPPADVSDADHSR